MCDYHSFLGEEDVQDAALVHSQRMDSFYQMVLDFQNKTDEESAI